MSELRWILLGLGLALLAGIYLFGVRRRTIPRPADPDNGEVDEELLHSLHVQRGGDDADLGDAVRELDHLIGSRFGGDEPDYSGLDKLVPDRKRDTGGLDIESGMFRGGEKRSHIYKVEPNPVATGEELIIVLNVMAEPGQFFSGEDLKSAFAEVDMVFGDMQIFHHFGVGEQRGSEPVFSAANILEPGIFDKLQLEHTETPGLCLFMRLPGVVDGNVAFELMLNTGRRLAELLGGELRDDTRSVVTAQTITHLRDKLNEFKRRQRIPAEQQAH